MTLGKTIRIYLDDGDVTGVRHAEIVNWTGQAISCPRSKIKELKNWEESKRPGVYFLFGVDEITNNDAVYIGETENVFDRVIRHSYEKDFWNEIVFFTSKDENLTKSHVKYLESRLVSLAEKANRQVIYKGKDSLQPVLPRGDKDAMEEFIAHLKILLGVLGHKTLESLDKKASSSDVMDFNQQQNPSVLESLEFYLNVKGLKAKAHVTDEGVVVLADSSASKTTTNSLSAGYEKFRDQLIQNGVLVESDAEYKFAKNQLFKSSSQAAAIIVGYAMNGRETWKTDKGVSLKMIEESDQS